MRNEFAEWHEAWLAEWHNLVACNVCRMTQRNKLNWKVRPFWRQSICKRSRCFNVDIRWQSKSHEGSLSISLFRTATKILLAFISRAAWQHRYYSTKVGHNWRKSVLEGHAPFYFNFFCKNVCTINFTVSFYLYLYLHRVRSVSLSNGGIRDLDIIFRDEMILYSCILFLSRLFG